MDDIEMTIEINKEPSFTEVWYEGKVMYEGVEHAFWLLDPQGDPPFVFDVEIRWFYKSVPKEVRALYPEIIKLFKEALKNEN
jgi:hypothetical protein